MAALQGAVPTALMGTMTKFGKDKPFTYCPGGLDFSELKSPRMAKRLARYTANAELSKQVPFGKAGTPDFRENNANPIAIQARGQSVPRSMTLRSNNASHQGHTASKPVFKKQRSITDLLSMNDCGLPSDIPQQLPPVILPTEPYNPYANDRASASKQTGIDGYPYNSGWNPAKVLPDLSSSDSKGNASQGHWIPDKQSLIQPTIPFLNQPTIADVNSPMTPTPPPYPTPGPGSAGIFFSKAMASDQLPVPQRTTFHSSPPSQVGTTNPPQLPMPPITSSQQVTSSLFPHPSPPPPPPPPPPPLSMSPADFGIHYKIVKPSNRKGVVSKAHVQLEQERLEKLEAKQQQKQREEEESLQQRLAIQKKEEEEKEREIKRKLQEMKEKERREAQMKEVINGGDEIFRCPKEMNPDFRLYNEASPSGRTRFEDIPMNNEYEPSRLSTAECYLDEVTNSDGGTKGYTSKMAVHEGRAEGTGTNSSESHKIDQAPAMHSIEGYLAEDDAEQWRHLQKKQEELRTLLDKEEELWRMKQEQLLKLQKEEQELMSKSEEQREKELRNWLRRQEMENNSRPPLPLSIPSVDPSVLSTPRDTPKYAPAHNHDTPILPAFQPPSDILQRMEDFEEMSYASPKDLTPTYKLQITEDNKHEPPHSQLAEDDKPLRARDPEQEIPHSEGHLFDRGSFTEQEGNLAIRMSLPQERHPKIKDELPVQYGWKADIKANSHTQPPMLVNGLDRKTVPFEVTEQEDKNHLIQHNPFYHDRNYGFTGSAASSAFQDFPAPPMFQDKEDFDDAFGYRSRGGRPFRLDNPIPLQTADVSKERIIPIQILPSLKTFDRGSSVGLPKPGLDPISATPPRAMPKQLQTHEVQLKVDARPNLDLKSSSTPKLRNINMVRQSSLQPNEQQMSSSTFDMARRASENEIFDPNARKAIVVELERSSSGRNVKPSSVFGPKRKPSQSPSMRLLGILHIGNEPEINGHSGGSATPVIEGTCISREYKGEQGRYLPPRK